MSAAAAVAPGDDIHDNGTQRVSSSSCSIPKSCKCSFCAKAHGRNFAVKCGGAGWCETNILRNLKKKYGGHGTLSPHCLKSSGGTRGVPRVPYLIAPMPNNCAHVKAYHEHDRCPVRYAICYSCKKRGHFPRPCRSRLGSKCNGKLSTFSAAITPSLCVAMAACPGDLT